MSDSGVAPLALVCSASMQAASLERILPLILLAGVVACRDSRTWPEEEPPDASTVARCRGKPGELRGKSSHEIQAGGLARSFMYYAPPHLDANEAAPVVIVVHGYGMNAEQMFEITQYSAIADREEFVVLFPNGQERMAPWNVGDPDCITPRGPLPLAGGDDDSFLDEMLAFAERDQCLDREHVYLTGFSMGGYFTNHAGCTRTDLRAIAPNASGTHALDGCATTRLPVLVLHFEDDILVPFACGTQTRDRWLAHNGCDVSDPQVRDVAGGQCAYYRGCPEDGQVAMCSFKTPSGERTERDLGHAWSGGSKEGAADGGVYAVPETGSATELSWEFFERYAW